QGCGLTTHVAPRAIGDHGAPVSLPKLKNAYEKGTRGISWSPLLTPGPSGSAQVSKWSVRPCCAVTRFCLFLTQKSFKNLCRQSVLPVHIYMIDNQLPPSKIFRWSSS
ncbi:unnamed protein product, partial [Staurois parvus]